MTSTALLVVGNEEYLRARATKEFLSRLRTAEPDLACAEAEAETLTVHDVNEYLGPNLFGGFPVLTITTGNKLTKEALASVVAYVNDPSCAVIIDIPKPADAGGKAVISALTKAGATHETVTPPKNAGDKKKFAQTELRRVGVRADGEAINALVDGEPDYRGIAIRAEQLAADHKHDATQPTVNAAHVNTIVTSSTANGFAVSDALLTRNPRAIATATRIALDAGTVPMLIQTACMMTLRDLANINTGNTNKMPPWKAQKLRGAANRWNSKDIANAVHEMGVLGETFRSVHYTENALIQSLLRAAGTRPPS